MTRTCPKCDVEKPLEEGFYRRTGKRAGEFTSWCKACHRAYYRRKKEADPQYFMRYQARTRAAKRKEFTERKVAAGCEDCGESHPACLEYHHLDPSQKEREVMKLVDSNASRTRIEAEVSKCVVLCSNCHRKRHYNERQAKSA